LQARVLALQGRGGDTRIAHVTPGELVIPERLKTPEVMGALRVAAMHMGIDPDRLEVGSESNSTNPETGEPEFAEYLYHDLGAPIENITVTAYPKGVKVPPKVSTDQNMDEAKASWNPLWFYNQVRNKGPWDYKQKDAKYQNFGNFNYGAVGTAFGLPEQVLLRGAGWAQGQSGNDGSGKWWGDAPHGDDPADQDMIKKGIEYAKRGRGSY